MHLRSRGTTWVWESPGPPGAPTLLLLHGWTATAALNWFPSLGPLGERYHVVAMDLRGHGRGIRSRRPFRLEACADDAAALCQALLLEPVTAVGYSMGGPVAQLLWRRHPQSVAGLVLCATAGCFTEPSPAVQTLGRALAVGVGMLPAAAQARLARCSGRFRPPAKPPADWAVAERRPSSLGALIGAGVALNGWNAQRWLADIDVPVAIVQTRTDRVVTWERQLRMAEAIAGARVFPIDADHGACVERADLFVPALLDACAAVASHRPQGARDRP
ncbi:MAG: alpha/beta fold hydrolase [Acidimicrobiales bacterium]